MRIVCIAAWGFRISRTPSGTWRFTIATCMPMHEMPGERPRVRKRIGAGLWFAALVVISPIVVIAVGAYAVLFAQESRSPRLVVLMYHRFVSDEEYRNCHGID